MQKKKKNFKNNFTIWLLTIADMPQFVVTIEIYTIIIAVVVFWLLFSSLPFAPIHFFFFFFFFFYFYSLDLMKCFIWHQEQCIMVVALFEVLFNVSVIINRNSRTLPCQMNMLSNRLRTIHLVWHKLFC